VNHTPEGSWKQTYHISWVSSQTLEREKTGYVPGQRTTRPGHTRWITDPCFAQPEQTALPSLCIPEGLRDKGSAGKSRLRVHWHRNSTQQRNSTRLSLQTVLSSLTYLEFREKQLLPWQSELQRQAWLGGGEEKNHTLLLNKEEILTGGYFVYFIWLWLVLSFSVFIFLWSPSLLFLIHHSVYLPSFLSYFFLFPTLFVFIT
jgi:hypothetical protein